MQALCQKRQVFIRSGSSIRCVPFNVYLAKWEIYLMWLISNKLHHVHMYDRCISKNQIFSTVSVNGFSILVTSGLSRSVAKGSTWVELNLRAGVCSSNNRSSSA